MFSIKSTPQKELSNDESGLSDADFQSNKMKKTKGVNPTYRPDDIIDKFLRASVAFFCFHIWFSCCIRDFRVS
jgi:hypothetical protein